MADTRTWFCSGLGQARPLSVQLYSYVWLRARRPVWLLLLGFIVLFPQPVKAQPGNLKFFKNQFVTGSHFAAGVSLKDRAAQDGSVIGTIHIDPDDDGESGVPPGAEIVGAWLYWQTVAFESYNAASGSTFNGAALGGIAKFLNPSGTPPCWSSGGATGGGGAHKMKSYRADVLPFLPEGPDGKRTALGDHTVRFPHSNGNGVPSTAGASLVVIYRDPRKPLHGTVIDDGGHTMNQGTPTFAQTVQGFYQAAAGGTAKTTSIVANGQSNFGERLVVKDQSDVTLFTAVNPFIGPAWDNYNASITLASDVRTLKVEVDRGVTSGSFDCLSWSAVIVSVPLKDLDVDGIVDILETPETSGTISDPNGEQLPDLYAMGARPNIPDIFVEIGWMKSTRAYNNPLQAIPANHSHQPSRDALNMLARLFKDAPTGRINIHFDVGTLYQDGALPSGGWNSCPTATGNDWTPNCAIIREKRPDGKTLADGGEFIEETLCNPTQNGSCLFEQYPGPLPCTKPINQGPCDFKDFPGTVGWKSGFRAYKDEPLTHRKTKTVNGSLVVDNGPDERGCFLAESDVLQNGSANLTTNCERRFARSRKDIFHYALWVHAVGLPRDGQPSTPRNISGFADFAGRDLMIALGFFDGGVGTTIFQATTFAHELGHNLGRRHGGHDEEPNCKPYYQSVMNYLYQVRGLTLPNGQTVVGYSNQVLPGPDGILNENTLSELTGIGNVVPMSYLPRWYAPWDTSFIDRGLNTTFSTKRCNGAPVAGERMARLEGTGVSGPVDWNGDGSTTRKKATFQAFSQDLNFSGSFDSLRPGSNDWENFDLRQVGNGRSVGGWSLDSGFWDSGFWDSGTSDPGFWDSGFWDSGFWDSGFWDSGFWDSGFWDSGFEDDPTGVPQSEIDLDTAEALGNAPNSLTAAPAAGGKAVNLDWEAPIVGAANVDFYEVYRVVGTTVTEDNFSRRVLVARVDGPTVADAPPTAVQDTKPSNQTSTYFAIAQFKDGSPPRRSGVSNFATYPPLP